MRSKMFSPLTRGNGEWNPGNFAWFEESSTKDALHSADPGGHSRFVLHDKQLFRTMPKTFTTKQGAMQIYTSEDLVFKDRVSEFIHAPPPAIESSQLEDLPYKILQFGTYDENKTCLKFTRPSYDDVFLDEATRPGALPEVYLEDLKHKTRLFNKNRAATPKLRATERPRSVKYSATVELDMMKEPQVQDNLLSSAEKRRLLRPPSAPPQPMQSVQMRKNEIIRDQLKHIQAADRREKQKCVDFELVASLADDFKVKGIGGPNKSRRAYSSPVYRSNGDEQAYYIDDSRSLPLFIVSSTPFRSTERTQSHRRNSQDYEAVCFENYDKTSPTQYLDKEQRNSFGTKGPLVDDTDEVGVKMDEVNKIERGLVKDEGTAYDPEHRASEVSEDRCSSSRQIVIDLPDQNKEKPRSPLISEELQKEIDQAAERAKEDDVPAPEPKSGEEVSSILEESVQSVAVRAILTYPSFISLSSVNSTQCEKAPVEDTLLVDTSVDQESHEGDEKIITVEIDEDCKAGSEETEVRYPVIRRSGRRKKMSSKDIDSFKDAKRKLKQRPQHLRRSKGSSDVPAVSDGEYKEKIPPQSLVSIHKDVTSTDSLPKKKEKKEKGRKKRLLISADTMTLDRQNASNAHNECGVTEEDDAFSLHEPQTMLLDDDDVENDPVTPDSSQLSSSTPVGPKVVRKKVREKITRSETKDKVTTTEPPIVVPETAETAVEAMVDEVEEEFFFKQRQEDREKEQKAIERLEKQIGAADGSLKRLGEKVETLEKETNEQRDREAAERNKEKGEELAKKEEERRAYEEATDPERIMKAQEEEYERHLQNILAEEEERKKVYIEKMNKDEQQRDLKRKWALFRQSQNMELRQHVRLAKIKQKFTSPYKYSYFPLLKSNTMKISDPIINEVKTNKRMSVKRPS